MPRRPHSHTTGATGEAAFALLVAQSGHVWIPTSSDADYGLDGRVEVFVDERATGAEFGVQVKSSMLFRRNRKRQVMVKGITRDTAAYWATRLTPTLLVAYEVETGETYADWFHNLIGKDSDPKAKTVRVRMEPEPITSDSLQRFSTQAVGFHQSIVSQVVEPEVAKILRAYDELLSETLDWLHQQVVAWVFHPSGAPFLFAAHDPDSLDMAPEGSLSPPCDLFPMGIMPVFGIWDSFADMTLEVAGEIEVLTERGSGRFLSDALSRLALDLRALVDEAIPGQVHHKPRGRASLQWLEIHLPILFANITLSCMRGRDFQRQLHRIRNADLDRGDDSSSLTVRLRALSDTAIVVPAMQWTRGPTTETGEQQAAATKTPPRAGE